MNTIITETFGFDGGRQVSVYVPPDPPEVIVFTGDGQGIPKWAPLLEKAGVPPTMIVGVHSLTDETLRLHEYSLGFDPERFAAHEQFFVEDVRRWTESRFGVALPAKRTAVFGVSAGGELALALGLWHPDVYGAISARRLERVTSPLLLFPVRFRAPILSPVHRSRFFSRMPKGGRRRCIMQVRMW